MPLPGAQTGSGLRPASAAAGSVVGTARSKSADVGRSDRAVPASGGDTHAYLSLRQPCSLLAGHMLHKPGDPLAGFDFARLAPYLPALAEGYGHEGCQFA